MKRAACYLLPPLICLAVFWRVPFIWFLTDDFGWFILPQHVHGLPSLLGVLFHPEAQDTVRVLSERVLAPFRVCTLATWFAVLTLANAIGVRLTGSRLAGVAAAVL